MSNVQNNMNNVLNKQHVGQRSPSQASGQTVTARSVSSVAQGRTTLQGRRHPLPCMLEGLPVRCEHSLRDGSTARSHMPLRPCNVLPATQEELKREAIKQKAIRFIIEDIKTPRCWKSIASAVAPQAMVTMSAWPKDKYLIIEHKESGRTHTCCTSTNSNFADAIKGKTPVKIIGAKKHMTPALIIDNNKEIGGDAVGDGKGNGDCIYYSVMALLPVTDLRDLLGMSAHKVPKVAEKEAKIFRQRLGDHLEANPEIISHIVEKTFKCSYEYVCKQRNRNDRLKNRVVPPRRTYSKVRTQTQRGKCGCI